MRNDDKVSSSVGMGSRHLPSNKSSKYFSNGQSPSGSG
jgi:hypothetical protein